MDSEKKDFKAVKVNIKSGTKNITTVSRSMLYSGVNIFGQLTQQYMANKADGILPSTTSSGGSSAQQSSALESGGGQDLMNLPSEVLMIFKRVQKKDPVTKCKALRELDAHLEQTEKYSEEHANLLTFFLYHYCRIQVYETDKMVREAAQVTLGSFIVKGAKRLGPHLGKILPIWFCSFFDPALEVAQQGRKNFLNAFKENGHMAFKMAFQYFLHFADEHLRQSEDQMAEGTTDWGKTQKEENYDRIISAIFLALGESFSFTQKWSAEERQYYMKKLVSYLDLKKKEEAPAATAAKASKKKPDTNRLWLFLSKPYRGRIRSSCLVFASKFLMNLPAEQTESHVTQLAPLIFEMVQEDNSIVQSTLWKEAYFTLGKHFPQVWSSITLKKAFIPGLMTCLKNAGFGATFAIFPNLVKFVSVFPLFKLVDFPEEKNNKYTVKDRAKFLVQFYQHLFAGLKNDEAPNFHKELTGAYFETLAFFILKRFQPYCESINYDEDDANYQYLAAQLRTIISLPATDFLAKYAKGKSKIQNQRNIRSTIPERFAKFLSDLLERNPQEQVLSLVVESILDTYSYRMSEANALKFSKQFIKMSKAVKATEKSYLLFVNEKMNIGLVDDLFTEIEKNVKDLGRKNLDSTLQLASNVQNFVLCHVRHSIKDDCFKSLSLSRLQTLIKELHSNHERNSSRLSEGDVAKINSIKQVLVTLALLSINTNASDSEALCQFFNFVLVDSGDSFLLDLKKLVVLPQTFLTQKEDPSLQIDVKPYFQQLRKHEEPVKSFIMATLVEDEVNIESNYKVLAQILKESDSASTDFKLFEKPAVVNEIAQGVFARLKAISLKKKLSYLRAVEHILSQEASASVFEADIIFKFQSELIDAVLHIDGSKASQAIAGDLWALFERVVKKQQGMEVLNRCKVSLRDTMKSTLAKVAPPAADLSAAERTKLRIVNQTQISSVNHLTQIIRDFISLFEVSKRQEAIEFIVMHEENFSGCETNYLPMKVFRDIFLAGGVGFNVSSLFSAENNQQYAWFAFLLLNVDTLSTLNNLPDLKKQIGLFRDTEILTSVLVAAQDGQTALTSKLVELFKAQILEAGNLAAIPQLESFLSKLVNPGEDFGGEAVLKVDDFKNLFKILSMETANKFLASDYDKISSSEVKLLSVVLRSIAYFILDEPEVLQMIKLSKKNLHIDILTKVDVDLMGVVASMEVYLSLYKHFVTEYDKELQEVVLQWIVGNFSENFFSAKETEPAIRIYQINIILSFITELMNQHGINKFISIVTYIPEDTLMADKQEKIKAFRAEQANKPEGEEQKPIEEVVPTTTLETVILQVVKLSHEFELAPETFIRLLTLIRKVIPNPKLIQSRQFLIGEMISMSEDKAMEFNSKLAGGLAGEETGEIAYLEEEMLTNFADTLTTCTMHIDESVDENSLFVLINSGFVPLQKAAYFMLGHLYQNFIPNIVFSRDEEKEMELLEAAAKDRAEGEEEEKLDDEAAASLELKLIKDKFEFKNIPQVLIDTIENPPKSVSETEEKGEQTMKEQLEALIFGETKEGCLSRQAFGYLLAWSSLLQKIDNGRIKSQLLDRSDYAAILGTITEYFEQNTYVYEMLLVILLAYLPKTKRVPISAQDLADFNPVMMDLGDSQSTKLMSLYSLVGFMKCFPSLARKFYSNCDKQLMEIVIPYLKQTVSPAILENEIMKIEMSQITLKENGQGEGLAFSLFKSTKEIIADYTKGEVSMQLKITIPSDYPLKSVQVEVGQQIRITERQKNKWVLAIKNLLQIRNGDIISAVLLWKSNIDKEIDGLEDCLICYCVLHPTDKSLPKMPCKNCHLKFHVSCIRKWFKTSNKSNCPMCQQYFF